MLRAAAKVESIGLPTVSLVCHGFEGLANATASGLGLDGLPLAVLQGHVDTQTSEEMLQALLGSTFDQIESGLLRSSGVGPEPGDESPLEYEPTDIVVSGPLHVVNEAFIDRCWSEGSPFVPPTLEAVRGFLQAGAPAELSEDRWHQSLGTMKPSGRSCTPWSVAVNGVMAGCEPRQLPALLAIAKILLDPRHGVEHSGNTTGADALIIIGGPGVSDLGFLSGQGALREGVRANTTVGRWLRLFLRNICGFLPGTHDKATFGNSSRVVFVEDHKKLKAIGWDGIGCDLGCAADETAVSLGRFNSGVLIGSVVGSTPEEILPYLADGLVRVSSWELTHVYGIGQGHYRPLLILSPMLATIFGDSGWSKDDVRNALFDQARMSAAAFERYIGKWSNLTAGHRTLQDLAAFRKIPKLFGQSVDPNRLVPIVTEPSKFLLAVGGDPDRANAYAMSNDGPHGYPTARSIVSR